MKKLLPKTRRTVDRKLLKACWSIQKAQEDQNRTTTAFMHDRINPLLFILRLNTKRCMSVSALKQNRNLLSENIEKIDQLIAEFRNLSYDLYPSTLKFVGLIKSMNTFCKMLQERELIQVEFKNNVIENTLVYSEFTQILIFKIFRQTSRLLLGKKGHKDLTVEVSVKRNMFSMTWSFWPVTNYATVRNRNKTDSDDRHEEIEGRVLAFGGKISGKTNWTNFVNIGIPLIEPDE